MGTRHKQTPSKRTLARVSGQTFDRFMADFNAGAAERQTAEENAAEKFAEKYLSAMRRKLGLEEGGEE